MQLQNNLSKFVDNILLELQKDYSEIWDDKIDEKLKTELKDHRESLKSKLLTDSPYIKNRIDLINAERDCHHYGGSESSIHEDLSNYKKLCPSIDGSFWLKKRKEIDKIKKDKKGSSNQPTNTLPTVGNLKKQETKIRRNLQESWRKDYEKLELEWELSEIDRVRYQLLKNYSDWLDKIREISQSLSSFGFGNGLLWDLSIGTLCTQDVSQLLRWAEYLRDNDEIKKLCDLMGKMHKESYSQEIIKIQTTFYYENQYFDVNSKEEITGIKLGNDLENIIPQELSFLTDPDISILFDLKYVENKLMCFEKAGIQIIKQEEIQEKERQIEVVEKKGPIIVCVDTSGSMSGAPETIAKALTLFLAGRAATQKRPCYLINFSTTIETIDLQPPKGVKDLIDFLKISFHGGTDVEPAINEAVRKMKSNAYKKADLLVISDFVISITNEQLKKSIVEQKLNKNRFYALSIGQFRMDNLDDIFDSQWNYDAHRGTVSQLNHVVELVSKGQ